MPLSPRVGPALVTVGSEVQLTSDAALAFQLAKGHGGWAPPMADCLGRCGTVVDVVNSAGDVRVNCGEFGSYVWNPAAVVGPAIRSEGQSILALDLYPRRLFSSSSTHGRCNLCRRSLEGDSASSPLAEGVSEAAPSMAFCSRDGAFNLCYACAELYMEPPREASAASDAPAPRPSLDCPGRHGLSDLETHGSARCDVCSQPLASGEVLHACRSCNWGVCGACIAASPQEASLPRLEIGTFCRIDFRGKPVRAVIVDIQELEKGPPKVLLHYPGHSAEAHDEWVEVTSQRIVPVDPPAATLRSHPAHRYGLTPAPMPHWPDRGPRCIAEVKFPGGCRRFAARARGDAAPARAVGLYSERDEFFLCPWCSESTCGESASSSTAVTAAYESDVAALRDPVRCHDAAARIARQCSRSVAALAGLLEAGAVEAVAAALAFPPPAGFASSDSVLSLFLDMAEWLFNDPLPPSIGELVLCEGPGCIWRCATVDEIHHGSGTNEQVYTVSWASASVPEEPRCYGLHPSQLRRLLGTGLIRGSSRRQTRRRAAPSHRVPPPTTLARDFLMKKAIPADNTAQARQYLIDGADLTVTNEAGDGLLVLALEHGCTPKMIHLLLEFGCPLTAGTTLGEPLQLAARYGQHENMELLLDARADPRTLNLEALPARAAQRIAPLAQLLSIGGRCESAAANASLHLGGERAKLALLALPPLARLLARPPAELDGSPSQAEARLLGALDALLGARGEGHDLLDDCCLADLLELTQRLMTTYSASATRGALLLIRRLLRGGQLACLGLIRCGVQRFVMSLANAALSELPPVCTDSVMGHERSNVDIVALAHEVLSDINVLGLGAASPVSPEGEVSQIAADLLQVAQSASDVDTLSFRDAASRVLNRLGAVLSPSPSVLGQHGATAYELEAAEVPRSLLALLERGVISSSVLSEKLGAGGSAALTAALLRLVETTEALPVQPLPPYLSQASGLRVLSEPLVVVLERDAAQPECPPELVQRWLQAEPLLRVQDVERMVLMTTPVLDEGFLAWCLGLVDQDVALMKQDGRLGPVAGHVTDFRLATPLRVPVHTVRSSDGREVDLVSSLHGLVAAGPPPDIAPIGLDLRVSLLCLEASVSVAEFGNALVAVKKAAREGKAVVATTDTLVDSSMLPQAADKVLRALGFQEQVGRADATERLWLHEGECQKAGLLEEISQLWDGAGSRQRALSAASVDHVEPDPALVEQLAAIFSEHGARRACSAVKNSSVEAAMEWACQHQGDHNFNDPFPDPSNRGCAADPKAPVWSVFIVLPQGIPFDLVWPMLEDPVKGALTSVANAWTAMGWAGGEAEMRETIRILVEKNGEGPIARGLPRAKAERVASRLRSACECRVDADPEGAHNAPRGRAGPSGEKSIVVGTRVQLMLEAEQLGVVAAVAESGESLDIVTDDGRLLSELPMDQVRVAPRTAPLPASAAARPAVGFASPAQMLLQGASPDAGLALTSVAEPITAPPLTPLQCVFGALDRGAQESDVVRRFQPQDLLDSPSSRDRGGRGEAEQRESEISLQPAPQCRVSFSLADPRNSGLDPANLCLLRGERSWIAAGEGRSFASTSWLTVGIPGLAVSAGSWHYEVQLAKFKNPQIGWADASFRFLIGAYSDTGVGDDNGSWAADGERCCLWHKGRIGEWRTASSGQTIGCAIAIDSNAQARMWFAVDGNWDPEPVFRDAAFYSYMYPAVSGELDATFHCFASEMAYGPPDSSFRPIGEAMLQDLDDVKAQVPRFLLLPTNWTLLQGLYRMAANQGLPAAPVPHVLRTKVHVDFGDSALRHQNSAVSHGAGESEAILVGSDRGRTGTNPLSLGHRAIEDGLPLILSSEDSDRALEVCGIGSTAARAALRLLRMLQAEPAATEPVVALPPAAAAAAAAAATTSVVAMGTENNEPEAPPEVSKNTTQRGGSLRLGTKLQSHLGHPLACCSGAFPRWCRELPILTPWLFPLEAREALLRCSAFGVTFAVRWLQEKAVDERFAERRRNAEERLAQAKHIGDATLLNSAYESYFELQGQIARDSEAWVGSLKSELIKVERDKVLQQAECAMELTKASPCALEVQFEGESGFGRAVTQGFYTLVAHELQRRTENRDAPMWVEDDGTLNEVSSDEFLRPRRGLLVRPLPQHDARLPQVERRFCMLGRLMAKALREGFVVPLPLTSAFFQLVLGGPIDPLAALPKPGDGVAGEFVGACAALVADAARGPVGHLHELAADTEWSWKYMQSLGEEPIPPASFMDFASASVFLETGLSGAPLCEGGECRGVSVENVEEFVSLASSFWLGTGVQKQMIAFRRGLYDVLGGGAVALWAFSAAELRRLFCGEDEVVWTEKELEDHLHAGGGYGPESQQVRWLREELLAMAQPLRAKFLEFVTSCPRLPPGGLKELELSIHPDPDDSAGLPRSRACAHRLFLPRYASREALSRQLHEAILCSGGHHEQQLPP